MINSIFYHFNLNLWKKSRKIPWNQQIIGSWWFGLYWWTTKARILCLFKRLFSVIWKRNMADMLPCLWPSASGRCTRALKQCRWLPLGWHKAKNVSAHQGWRRKRAARASSDRVLMPPPMEQSEQNVKQREWNSALRSAFLPHILEQLVQLSAPRARPSNGALGQVVEPSNVQSTCPGQLPTSETSSSTVWVITKVQKKKKTQ